MPHLGQKEWEKSVIEKGASMRKTAMMLPDRKVKRGKGLESIFSVN